MVTGCRDWSDREAVDRELTRYYPDDSNEPFSLVVGDCPSGADRFAREWCQAVDTEYLVFEAGWSDHRLSAGPMRNRRMAREGGADICLAFWDGKSRGTSNAITEAVLAGIPVQITPAAQPPAPPEDAA